MNKKIDTIEEKFFVMNEMVKETFDKFSIRYRKEKENILEEVGRCGNVSSNKLSALRKAITMSAQLPEIWKLVPAKTKEMFQKLVFPEGITFEKSTGRVLTKSIPYSLQYLNYQRVAKATKKGHPPFYQGSPFVRAAREHFLTMSRFIPLHSQMQPRIFFRLRIYNFLTISKTIWRKLKIFTICI